MATERQSPHRATPPLQVQSHAEFRVVVADNSPSEWRHWVGHACVPEPGAPTEADAGDCIFLPEGQELPPFWKSTKHEEWVTWDGPADVGYVSVATVWHAVTGTVIWDGQHYVYVGKTECRGRTGPSYIYFRKVAAPSDHRP